MFLTLLAKECYDHLLSFRFGAVLLLTVLLMAASVLVHSLDYRQALRTYPRAPGGLVEEDGTTQMMMLPCRAWGVHKAPAPLAFCAGSGERELPDFVVTALHGAQSAGRNVKVGELLTSPTSMHWGFVVAILLSFAAGLLTYKSVSGESRDGTLTLLLSSPVPKITLLSAKYLAALIALAVALGTGMAAALLIVQAGGESGLTAIHAGKLALIALTSLLYLSIFISLGLLCSVATRTPVLSAVAFLFAWTFLAFVVPNLGGSIAGLVGRVQSPAEINRLSADIDVRFPFPPGVSSGEYAAVRLRREEAREQLFLEYLQALVRQVDVGRNVTRLSPTSAYTYAVESLADLGVQRLTHFVANVVRYRKNVFAAVLAADREDPASEHRYTPWACGGQQFTRRVVDLGPVKEFQDTPSTPLEGLHGALMDILLLGLENLIVFAAAFWTFVRRDVVSASGV
jgi:ABC-type transport system involved in multi-copper enzyme maturation permease subunit